MKKNYFLLSIVFAFLFANMSYSEECPTGAGTTGTAVFIFYVSGTSDCIDRPASITVGGSIFTSIICTDSYSQYQLTSGSPLTQLDPFTIDTGFNTPCTYIGGTLGAEEIGIINKATFKLYPNPYSNTLNENLNIQFAIETSAEISLYDISGKVIMSDTMNNSNNKKIK